MWVVVPLLLDGQFPSCISAGSLRQEYGKPDDEACECHASVLVIELSAAKTTALSAPSVDGGGDTGVPVATAEVLPTSVSWRAERLDSYRADPPGGTTAGWCRGRYCHSLATLH